MSLKEAIMKNSKIVLKRNFMTFLIILGITLFIGVFFIYSSLFAIQNIKEINPDQKFQTYVLALLLGFSGAIIAFIFGDIFIKSEYIMISFFVFLNLLLIIVLLSNPIAGVRRWINLGGFQFQPSELAKLLLPAFLAFYYGKIKAHKNIFLTVIFPIFLCFITITLIYLEPDLSSTIIVGILAFVTIFLGIKDKKSIILFLFIIVFMVLTLYLFKDQLLESYQLSRIKSPDTFQSQQARDAIMNGGLFGVGPFNGEFKYYVPESYSDFIIAVIGEEWGKLGIAMVVTLFFFLCYELIYMASLTNDHTTFVFCSAISFWIFFQVTINTLVGLGAPWMPVTGVTLPLMSYGNSSMIVTLISIGWALGLIYNNSELKNIDE